MNSYSNVLDNKYFEDLPIKNDDWLIDIPNLYHEPDIIIDELDIKKKPINNICKFYKLGKCKKIKLYNRKCTSAYFCMPPYSSFC